MFSTIKAREPVTSRAELDFYIVEITSRALTSQTEPSRLVMQPVCSTAGFDSSPRRLSGPPAPPPQFLRREATTAGARQRTSSTRCGEVINPSPSSSRLCWHAFSPLPGRTHQSSPSKPRIPTPRTRPLPCSLCRIPRRLPPPPALLPLSSGLDWRSIRTWIDLVCDPSHESRVRMLHPSLEIRSTHPSCN